MAQRLEVFTPKVLAKGTTGAPTNVVEDTVREVCIDLCQRAGVWRFESIFDLQDNVGDYPLMVPEPSRVVCVETVDFGGRIYRPMPGNNWCNCGHTRVVVPNPGQVIFHPMPRIDCTTVCTITMQLKPEHDALVVPDMLFDEYADAIATGAAARLFMVPQQPWTNLGVAQRLLSLYEAAVTRAKNRRVMERTAGSLYATGSYF